MTDIDRNVLLKRVKETLIHFVGPDDCISMADLLYQVSGEHIIPYRRYDQTRIIRSLVKQLRREGCPIGNVPKKNGGYFWASTEKELATTIDAFHGRAMSALAQEAALKRISFSDLLKQYEIEFMNQSAGDNDDPQDAH